MVMRALWGTILGATLYLWSKVLQRHAWQRQKTWTSFRDYQHVLGNQLDFSPSRQALLRSQSGPGAGAAFSVTLSSRLTRIAACLIASADVAVIIAQLVGWLERCCVTWMSFEFSVIPSRQKKNDRWRTRNCQNERHTGSCEISEEIRPKIRIRTPRARKPQHSDAIDVAVVPLERNLYGHRNFEKILFEEGRGRVPGWCEPTTQTVDVRHPTS